MNRLPRVLIIDDEPDMLRAINFVLRKGGFAVEIAAGGAEGTRLLRSGGFDAVVLDILMPGMDGFETLTAIRAQHPRLAVLMLSAMSTMESKMRAFDSDADDYMTKPFGIMELPARVRALLRRTGAPYALSLDVDRRQLEVAGRRVPLSRLELKVMQYLLAHAGRTVTHHELLQRVWKLCEHAAGTTPRPVNRVLATLSSLRRKIGGRSERLIQTVPGGYRLQADACQIEEGSGAQVQ